VENDPVDGLPVDGPVGPWARDKHALLRRYVSISRGARKNYLPPVGTGGASYIDLYSGYGRSLVTSGEIIDGSPLVAFCAARDGNARFSEIHLADLEERKSETAKRRIVGLGGSAKAYAGPAVQTVQEIVDAINPFGLHFAFLDPYNLQDLPFGVIAALARLKRIDMLVHVSAQDLQRNLQRNIAEEETPLDIFMPGWRDVVDTKQAQQAIRAQLFEFWLSLIRKLGLAEAKGMPLIKANDQQRLYWLVFVSHSQFANHLWDEISSLSGQRSLV
jgi:three-Cys-motif partner protein